MKIIHKLCALLTIALACTAPAEAGRAKDLASAYRKAGDKPIVAFIYGANFSPVNDKAYTEFIKRRQLFRGIPWVDYIDIPIYQSPDKKEQKEWDKILGGAEVPSDGVWTLPCILILDGAGNTRGWVRDHKDMKDPETARLILKEKLEAFKKQEKLIEKAMKSKTKRRFEYLAEASNLGLEVPEKLIKDATDPSAEALAEAEEDGEFLPQDFDEGTDYQKRLLLHKGNWEELLLRIDRMSVEEADTYIRNHVANKYLTDFQRQELLCALSGHVRRSGGSAEDMRKVYQDIIDLGPESMYGLYATECILYYCDKVGNDSE